MQTALEDAGLEKDAVKFSKQMRTYEDGMPVYEIKFVVPGEANQAELYLGLRRDGPH